ncbi:hypothetical protein EHE09_01715 [Brucella melitensis]|nr:hypothetical protein EHE09_01715 [Brucella melitensis]
MQSGGNKKPPSGRHLSGAYIGLCKKNVNQSKQAYGASLRMGSCRRPHHTTGTGNPGWKWVYEARKFPLGGGRARSQARPLHGRLENARHDGRRIKEKPPLQPKLGKTTKMESA